MERMDKCNVQETCSWWHKDHCIKLHFRICIGLLSNIKLNFQLAAFEAFHASIVIAEIAIVKKFHGRLVLFLFEQEPSIEWAENKYLLGELIRKYWVYNILLVIINFHYVFCNFSLPS